MKRSRPPQRRTRVKAANPKRKAAEFARCYHSEERVVFVQGLQCGYCDKPGRCDNAHLPSKHGMGRKGPYTDIVPLHRGCHHLLDLGGMSHTTVANLRAYAVEVERLWQAHQLAEH